MSKITFQGNPLTLQGTEVKVGMPAPKFSVLSNQLTAVDQSILKGKTTVIITVPSLDTPVCDMEVRRFNQEVSQLGIEVQVLCISMDLPFAQSRWCGTACVDNVTSLSDHATASFGLSYGLLVKELRLLTRAVLVVNQEGIIDYIEIVPEITDQPNYDAALAAIEN